MSAARAAEREKADALLRRMGFVPTRWEHPNGEVWVEEGYTTAPAFEVWGCNLETYDSVDGVRVDAAGIQAAVRDVSRKLSETKKAGA